jgi:hypothetical protein
MATKLLKLKELEEGEYETSFGRVVVKRTEGGYKIVAYVSEKELGRNAVKQILQSFLTPVGEKAV